MAAGTGSYRSVLVIRDFRYLVAGSAASQIGDWLYNVALLVYVYDTTGSAGWVAAATMVRLLPFSVLGPIGGVIADRYERTLVMVVSMVLQGFAMVAMSLVVAGHGPSLAVILLAGVNTTCGVAVRPAALASMPGIVGESGLAPGNALLHTVQDVGVVTGPALGAAILALGSPAEAFAFNTLSFLVGGVTFSAIRKRSIGSGESAPSALAQFKDGMRAVRHTRYVPVLTFLTFVGAFTYGAQTVQLVVYVQQQLNLSADGYGYLLGASGLGGVIGATVSNRFAARRRIAVPLMFGCVLFVGSQLVFAASSVVAVAIAIGVVAGFGMVIADVVAETAISRTASNEVMGRIFGAYDGISVGAMVLGALVAAPLVRLFGVRASMVELGVAAVAATLLCLPVLQGLDRLSASVVNELAPRLDALTKLSIFNGAPRLALERLAAAATEITVGAGTVVVAQGEPADAFYVCIDGTLDVSSSGEGGGPPRHLRALGAGAYFGEIGLLEQIPRTATVRATADCTLLCIPGDDFLDTLSAAPAGLSTMRDGVVRGLARTHPSVQAARTEALLAAIPAPSEAAEPVDIDA